jgi:hypothetical protein
MVEEERKKEREDGEKEVFIGLGTTCGAGSLLCRHFYMKSEVHWFGIEILLSAKYLPLLRTHSLMAPI